MGGKCIFKLARDRAREGKDSTRTSAMKRSDGKLVTGVEQVLGVWEEYSKKLRGALATKPGGRMRDRDTTLCKKRAGGEDNNRRRGGYSCKEDENWEGCRSGRTVSGNGEIKHTSGNQVADEAV